MKRVVLTVEDGATVAVTGGKTFDEQTEQVTDPETVQRYARQDEYDAFRADYLARLAAIETELANWATYDAAAIKQSLGQVIIPALRRTMRVSRWMVDYLFHIEGEAL